MDVLLYIGLFIVSLAVLLRASDWFVDSAEEIGLSLGISPFIIGVTIVAFGTSLPELATSIASVFDGKSEIVVANVVGSNITNIALVLGLVAVVVGRIQQDYNIWHNDMPYLWGSAFLLWFTLKDLHFSILEACLFLIGIIIFLFYSVTGTESGNQEEKKASTRSYIFLVLGGALVWLGAKYTINAIIALSEIAQVPADIITVSVVALGTSLPEVIVSLNAARKGKTSIAVGNVLGSNIFNTYIVMGLARFFGPLEIPEYIQEFSIPLMIAMTILFGIMTNNKKVDRWEGAVLLIFYAFFVAETIQRL